MSEGHRSANLNKRWWWLIIVILVPIIIFLLWVFRLRIERLFEQEPTLPPPPPTQESSQGDTVEGILYSTDFDDAAGLGDWETPFDDGIASAQFEGGRLVVGVDALYDVGTWLALNYTFDEFDLEVDTERVSGNEDGGVIILFRIADTLNYDQLDIYSDGYYRLISTREGVQRVISDYNLSPAIAVDAANHVTIGASGGVYTFAVNGVPLLMCVSDDPAVRPLWSADSGECIGGEAVTEWRGAGLSRGKIGLGVHAYSGFDGQLTTPAVMQAAFDNLVITSP